MRNRFCLLALSLMTAATGNSQTYTQYKTGPNTWGGAYVPPVWTKTYNLDIKPYQPVKINGATSPAGNTSGGGSPSGTAVYEKKKRFSFSIDVEDLLAEQEKQKQIDLKARQAAKTYEDLLNAAIRDFEAGNYVNAKFTLNYSINKMVSGTGEAQEKVYEYTAYLDDIKSYFEYLCQVKSREYTNALYTYNLILSKRRVSEAYKGYDEKSPYPFGLGMYFFTDTVNKIQQKGFDRFSVDNRFRGDLFFVETLAGLGKLEEANRAMDMIMAFYPKNVSHFEKFTAQIGICCFYLRKADRSRRFIEYYCNTTESYNARIGITAELLFNKSMKDEWNAANFPDGFRMIEENMTFIDSINKVKNGTAFFFTPQGWFELYVRRSSDDRKYLEKAEPGLDSCMAGLRKYSNSYELDYYLAALMKFGLKDKIEQTLSRVAAIAEERKAEAEAGLETDLKNIPYDVPAVYWQEYYRRKSHPAAYALMNFRFVRFADAGGTRYLARYAKPYVKALEMYSKEEVSSPFDNEYQRCGILPKYLKSRKYPDKI